MISITLTIIAVLISSLISAELLYYSEPPAGIFYEIIPFSSLEVERFVPKTILILILFIPMFLLIHVRIIIKTAYIGKSLENEIEKKGFSYILISVVFLIMNTVILSISAITGLVDSVAGTLIASILRMIFLILSVIFGYFGWIMPDWMKQRIQREDKISQTAINETNEQ